MGDIDIADLVRQGVAVVVATRDAEHRPDMSRAWGLALSEDGEQLTLCVEAAPDSPMARNLAAGSPVAASLARIATQTSVLFKGDPVAVAAPTRERLAAVDAHVDRFVAETAAVGVPEPIARALLGTDLLSVTIAVTSRADATPGPGAGRPL